MQDIIEVAIMSEAGHEEALLGMALSYHDQAEPLNSWWSPEKKARAADRALKLAGKGGGHDKFLESVAVWLNIRAPRYWWSEFDTYRVGVTKQSESTMHTLSKREPMRHDFSPFTPDSSFTAFDVEYEFITSNYTGPERIARLKAALPEGFMQRRIVATNYKALLHIIRQRHTHKLPEWGEFVEAVISQAERPEWLSV